MGEIKLDKSIKMAYVLRHNPSSVGLELDSTGTVELKKFCEALGFTEAVVREIVENDPKGRFILRNERISAAQGHSINVEAKLDSFIPTDVIYHGTKRKFLKFIMKSGLKPMSRTLVHLSTTVDTAQKVADRRKGESVILSIDAVRMVSEGHLLKISENGVVLVEHVPSKFIRIME